MRVLWLCNIMLPVIAKKLKLSYSNREGWLSGAYDRIKKSQEIELGICYPAPEGNGEPFQIESAVCYGFYENQDAPEHYDERLELQFQRIIESFRPDIVHIFGTEFPHSLAMVRVWRKPERTLIGIQGLCYKIGEVYLDGLPAEVVRRVTFRDWLRQDSLIRQKEKFVIRGRNECEALRQTGHITGRTDFDREGTAAVNGQARYHEMNETMRACFYTGKWDIHKCRRHGIFLGQGDYPLKGFHFMLEAMPLLLERHADTHLYVAGNSIINYRSLKDKLKISSYGQYLLSLIQKHRLQDQVTILGKLDEAEMKDQFLQSSVFVCPSVLENSPNGVAEAMLLGVPVVAAGTGGIPSMIEDGQNGLLFEPGCPRQLAERIMAAWDPETAVRLSNNAAARAAAVHDPERNYERLMEIYHGINLCV